MSEYDDWHRRNEAEALEIYQGQVERSEITAEQCTQLYFDWLARYRVNSPALPESSESFSYPA